MHTNASELGARTALSEDTSGSERVIWFEQRAVEGGRQVFHD